MFSVLLRKSAIRAQAIPERTPTFSHHLKDSLSCVEGPWLSSPLAGRAPDVVSSSESGTAEYLSVGSETFDIRSANLLRIKIETPERKQASTAVWKG
jgi:hypothetical protein